MATFTDDQSAAWDNHLHHECEMLLDSLSLADLPGAIKAAGIRPTQLFTSEELIGIPMRTIKELKERMLEAVHNMIDVAGFRADEIVTEDALDDWALNNGYVRDPKQEDII